MSRRECPLHGRTQPCPGPLRTHRIRAEVSWDTGKAGQWPQGHAEEFTALLFLHCCPGWEPEERQDTATPEEPWTPEKMVPEIRHLCRARKQGLDGGVAAPGAQDHTSFSI